MAPTTSNPHTDTLAAGLIPGSNTSSEPKITSSDDESRTKRVTEKMRDTDIAEGAAVAQSPLDILEAAVDAQQEQLRGRLTRKRSFDDVEKEEHENGDGEERARKRSRSADGIASDDAVSADGSRTKLVEDEVDDVEHDAEDSAVEQDVANGAADRPQTPEKIDTSVGEKAADLLASPKGKRNRDQFQEEEVEPASLAAAAAATASDKSNEEKTAADGRGAKRQRDGEEAMVCFSSVVDIRPKPN
jgi:hypothetical protein